jgi:hypothetical protein
MGREGEPQGQGGRALLGKNEPSTFTIIMNDSK